MTDQKNKSPLQYVNEIESIRLTNWVIWIAWRGTALLLTFPFRIVAVVLLAVMRNKERNRMS
jgi:hypothetical protein